MEIFWRLLLSHLLADFTLQFSFVNRLKRRSVGGMLLHCATHFAVSAALTWGSLGDIWFSAGGVAVTGWGALSIMLVVHFMVDQLRVYSVRFLKFRDGTASFIVDQVLHIYVIFLVSPIDFGASGLMTGEKWAALACMLVFVTHFATVLIYFVEKDLFGKGFPAFDEKYFLIFERVVIWAFFFAAGYWWLVFAAAWIFQLFYVKRKRIMDLSGINVWLSVAMAVLAGVCARFIYFGAL